MPPREPLGRRRAYFLRNAMVLVCVLAVLAGLVVTVGGWGDRFSGATPVATDTATTYTPPVLRRQVDLAGGGWMFTKANMPGAQASSFDDSSWTKVTVPHTWNAADGADGGDNYYRGVGWYRRHFQLDAKLAGKMSFLEFAGANQVADVWVNDTYLGQHRGGYSRFRFDATRAVRAGQENVLAVKVNNARDPGIAPLTADFTFEGGIYRGVSLWVVDPLQASLLDYAGPGVYLRQRSVTARSATVDVTTKVANNSPVERSVALRTVITDANGTVVADGRTPPRMVGSAAGAEVTQTFTISHPRRWDGLASPYRYRASVEIHDVRAGQITDVVTEPLGLRSFSVHPDRGFFLNEHPLRLRGVNLHQDRAGVGWATTDAQRTQDLDLIKEVGANAIRMAHYQHDQADYTLADEQGFVVWAEIPFIDLITDSMAFADSTEQQLRELIRQNFNHPSIVFWGIGNEQRRDDATTNILMKRLADVADAEDPERLSTYANCCLGATSALANHTRATAHNKYFGWYTGAYNNLGAWLDGLHAANPSRSLALSEYGAGANVTQHALNPTAPSPTGQVHPEEYQALLHEASWKQIEARPYLWGSFLWNMFDFASDARAEGGQPGINDKGLVTRDRAIRKDAFYWYKANWASTPTLYLTSRRWTQRTDATTEVKVYSNATTVAATLNGIPLGAATAGDRIFRWTGVTLRPGPNVVTVVAVIGGETVTDTVTWNL